MRSHRSPSPVFFALGTFITPLLPHMPRPSPATFRCPLPEHDVNAARTVLDHYRRTNGGCVRAVRNVFENFPFWFLRLTVRCTQHAPFHLPTTVRGSARRFLLFYLPPPHLCSVARAFWYDSRHFGRRETPRFPSAAGML